MNSSSLSDMHLKWILMKVSTKLEPQQDMTVLGKHQYHCCCD